ncbi:TPA: Hsp20/alpha crystallin family protein [Candidatus Saccharibacteria bacterium]|nr:Hsp20/alpha crystallin family protein [Candidatus Saccharibacteria bacterium]HIO87262.1 Hsp20/alpha crystallin family protein [Candidatus Saccharibacteria bacterium]
MSKLMRFDPFSDFEELQKQLFGSAFGGSQSMTLPTADVYVNEDKELIGEFAMPGFSEDEVEVSVHEGALEVRAQKSAKEENKDKDKRKYVVRESSSSFYRSIRLPQHANEEKVEAHFENGVLKVIVPFKELPKPKKIAIKAGKKK